MKLHNIKRNGHIVNRVLCPRYNITWIQDAKAPPLRHAPRYCLPCHLEGRNRVVESEVCAAQTSPKRMMQAHRLGVVATDGVR